jgi:hypothetical protein
MLIDRLKAKLDIRHIPATSIVTLAKPTVLGRSALTVLTLEKSIAQKEHCSMLIDRLKAKLEIR